MAFSSDLADIDWTFQCNHCSGIVSHNSDCTLRLVPCPFAYAFLGWGHQCDERFMFKNLLRDCEAKHGTIEVMENGITKDTKFSIYGLRSDFKDYSTTPVKIEAYGRVFITESVTMEGVYYQWVKLLGSPSEAKGFIFSLEYQGPKSTHVFLSEVAAIDDTVDDVISSGKSSSIGFRIFKNQFMNGNTISYSWSITVKRIDE